MPENEDPGYVVLKHKDSSVGHFAAVVPPGTSSDEVVEAWKPFGWQRGPKTELSELLDKPTSPAEPETTIKEK